MVGPLGRFCFVQNKLFKQNFLNIDFEVLLVNTGLASSVFAVCTPLCQFQPPRADVGTQDLFHSGDDV